MKVLGMRSPKLLYLEGILQVSRPTAIGHLELLWGFTAEYAPLGNVGKWPDEMIARACCWTDDSSKFIQSLIDSRWLDMAEDLWPEFPRLLVHDWPEHCPTYIKGNLASRGMSVAYYYTKPPSLSTPAIAPVLSTSANSPPATESSLVESCLVESSLVDRSTRESDRAIDEIAKADSSDGNAMPVGDSTAWERAYDDAIVVKKKLWDFRREPLNKRDWAEVLKACYLSRSVLSPEWLENAVEGVKNSNPKKIGAMLHTYLLNGAATRVADYRTLLAQLVIPGEFSAPPRREASAVSAAGYDPCMFRLPPEEKKKAIDEFRESLAVSTKAAKKTPKSGGGLCR